MGRRMERFRQLQRDAMVKRGVRSLRVPSCPICGGLPKIRDWNGVGKKVSCGCGLISIVKRVRCFEPADYVMFAYDDYLKRDEKVFLGLREVMG